MSRKRTISDEPAWPELNHLVDEAPNWLEMLRGSEEFMSMYRHLRDDDQDEEIISWVDTYATSCIEVVQGLVRENSDIPSPFPRNNRQRVSKLQARALWWLLYERLKKADVEYMLKSAPSRQKLLQELRQLASPSTEGYKKHMRPGAQSERSDGKQLASLAFDLGERRNAKGHLASERLYSMLLHYNELYASGNYLAPYTSLVGPSGMGKSFAVKQLACEHGLYVSYASLAAASSAAVPGRSALAWTLPLFQETEDKSFAFWQAYMRVAVALVEASIAAGLSARGHFYLQYHQACEDQQTQLASVVRKEAELAEKSKSSDRLLAKRLRPIVQAARSVVDENGWNIPPTADGNTQQSQTITVICIDEATGMFTDQDRDTSSGRLLPSRAFRNFRSALRSVRDSRASSTGSSEHYSGRLFGLLLDTSSHISNFAPPTTVDRSQKYPVSRKLLRPIYYLDTWDVFATANDANLAEWLDNARRRPGLASSSTVDDNFLAHGPDGSAAYQMFLTQFGRPLWASAVVAAMEMAMKEEPTTENAENAENTREEEDGQESTMKDKDVQEALSHVRSLASEKLTGTTPDHSIALLLCRLQFHVQDPRLAKDLVAKWMHYLAYVAMDRTWVNTCQPSEPVLALAAAQKLSDHHTRCRALRDFVQMHLRGVLHAGDCGELVAALLLLFAADKHLQHGRPRSVPLTAFLATLLGSAGDGGKSSHASDSNSDINSDWGDAEIFLTHFSRLRLVGGSRQSLTPNHLLSAFVLGQGYVLPQGMPGADLLVPVWLRSWQCMGALLVQVKNRANGMLNASMWTHARSSLETAVATLPFLNKTRVFGMYLSLRGSPASTKAQDNSLPVCHKWLPASKGQLPIVVTAGFGSSVFPVLKTPSQGPFMQERLTAEDDMGQILQLLLDNVGQVVLPDDRIEGVDSITYTREPL